MMSKGRFVNPLINNNPQLFYPKIVFKN